ncbi:DUF4258 domain-containing protein [Thermus thermamylovorans]|uniref:DUF4258 domain-containing protein n=1 Tax=Thermus thermamylovorans TaxID=2509362 RepID=A0A4Q9B5T0_9DEIN|nr:DUF4258 domain-containing protein [Thermus thermamylovorans]
MAGGEEPFDFSTSQIHAWEVERIRQAFRQGRYSIEKHAFRRMMERGIRPNEVRDVVMNGAAVSKDLPGNPRDRRPGINFERTLEDDRRVRVKVSWREGYFVVTTHEVSG